MSITIEEFSQIQFHYLIVGGGTAGLAVAARLSEDPGIQVGVVEAGPSALHGEPTITDPGRFGSTIGSSYDWKYETTPQAGLSGRKIAWPRGRVLGGTSALNLMAWNRGHKEDYDAWARLGNKGWAWDDLLPFFRRSETFHPPSAAHRAKYQTDYEAQFNGDHGPVQISHLEQLSPSHRHWHETLNSLGIASSRDSLAGNNVGVWHMLASVDPAKKERSYSAAAYYDPIASRSNLHVLTEATVLRLLLTRDRGEWVATGARVRHGADEVDIVASRETVVSAGSINSPQILELSGIGCPSVLREAGVEVKVNNAFVGENLQDHMMTATVFTIDQSSSSSDGSAFAQDISEAADHAHYTSNTGPWSVLPFSTSYTSLSGVATSSEKAELLSLAENVSNETGRPHDKVLAEQFRPESEPRGQLEFMFIMGNWSPYFSPGPEQRYGTMLQMLQYPFSRGSIHIKSNEQRSTIDDKPDIDPKYYIGPGELDKKVMAYGQRMVDRICSTEPLSNIIRGRVFPPLSTGSKTEDQINHDFVSDFTVTDWHPVGTCAMGGHGGAESGVVDERLRVYGVRGLRVIDASIMPLQIGAHLQATVYAIAEKGAAMIKEDWSGS